MTENYIYRLTRENFKALFMLNQDRIEGEYFDIILC